MSQHFTADYPPRLIICGGPRGDKRARKPYPQILIQPAPAILVHVGCEVQVVVRAGATKATHRGTITGINEFEKEWIMMHVTTIENRSVELALPYHWVDLTPAEDNLYRSVFHTLPDNLRQIHKACPPLYVPPSKQAAEPEPRTTAPGLETEPMR